MDDLVDFLPDATMAIDADGLVVVWNKAMEAMTGVPASDMLGKGEYAYSVPFCGERRPTLVDFVLSGAEIPADRYSNVIRNGASVRAETYCAALYEGKGAYVQATIAPLSDGEGAPRGAVASIRDISETRHALERLRLDEDRYRSIITVSNTGAWEYHHETGQLWCSPEYFTMLGYDPAEFDSPDGNYLDNAWIDLLHPDDKDRSTRLFADYIAAGSPGMYENHSRLRHKDGRWVWIWARAQTLRDASGKPGRLTVGTHIDETERKAAEESVADLLGQKEILLKETHHRVKNNMSIIQGLLFMQAEAQRDPAARAILNDAAGRAQSMMVLYDRLYRTENYRALGMREFLTPLVAAIVKVFPCQRPVRATVSAGDFVVSEKRLSSLGILVNELITNSMKYAFDGAHDAWISIVSAKEGRAVTLEYKDNGIGLPDSVTLENSTGFGMQLIGILAEQIHGSVRIERGEGATFVIEFDD